MSSIRVFVEGIADQKFISDLILFWYEVPLKINEDIIQIGGKDAFESPEKYETIKKKMEESSFLGKRNILILDADDELEVRRVRFNELGNNLNFETYFLPDNSNPGDLEVLLQNIINPENSSIFDCWDLYENCLKNETSQNTDSGQFTVPARKTKIYAYLEALLGESHAEKEKIKERNRNYCDDRHWNLSPELEILSGLRLFFDQYFQT